MTDSIAFMVMPFGRKAVAGQVACTPTEVDFDALWRRVHAPVLGELGYRPVRADSDLGALVINEMVQRLAIADLVVADISLPNANVYYEIGVRHAARGSGCVLIAAEWADPVFDVAQMRRVRYPLTDGSCGPEAAGAAAEALRRGLPTLVDGRSPVFEAVPGYPHKIDLSQVVAFEGLVDALLAFQRDVEKIKVAAGNGRRRALTLRLLEEYGSRPAVRQAVVVELIRLTRDHVGPEETLRYIRGLPSALRMHPPVIEQEQIALVDVEDLEGAAATLESLIRLVGPSADRCGILGGRYKRLLRSAAEEDRPYYLGKAIAAYEQGMGEDLNDYYPSSNLPRLYRERKAEGDEQRALDVATVVVAACERARGRGPDNEWILLTELGAAFDRGDCVAAEKLVAETVVGRPAGFHLNTTIEDLRMSYRLQTPNARDRLRRAMAQMEDMWFAGRGADHDRSSGR